jgi:hypothetical protein
MPFADAKYPPRFISRNFGHGKEHLLTLSNGELLLVREAVEEIAIAHYDGEWGEPTYWVCSISSNGVLAYSHASDACAMLTEGLGCAEDAKAEGRGE